MRSRSSGVGLSHSRRSPTTVIPGRPWIVPPLRTSATTPSSVSGARRRARCRRRRSRPGRRVRAGRRASGSATPMRSAVLVDRGRPRSTSVTRACGVNGHAVGRERGRADLGPGEVGEDADVGHARRATRSMRASASAVVPWASGIRATFIPAAAIATSVRGSSDAGPIVATIFVRRLGRRVGPYATARLRVGGARCAGRPTSRSSPGRRSSP